MVNLLAAATYVLRLDQSVSIMAVSLQSISGDVNGDAQNALLVVQVPVTSTSESDPPGYGVSTRWTDATEDLHT